MLGIFRKKKKGGVTDPQQPSAPAVSASDLVDVETSSKISHSERVEPEPVKQTSTEQAALAEGKVSFFQRLKQGLQKTRRSLGDGLARLILGKKEIDADLLEEIETQLLMADVGVEATQAISTALTDGVERKQLSDGPALMGALRAQLQQMIQPMQQPLTLASEGPFVILMVGINGAGKTTTIGKLAKQFRRQGQTVMLAAGDTFRAAAVEQLQVWGERNDIPVVAQQTGSDSASVIYDAYQSAKAKQFDVLIADTAGRLHTQSGLMEELKKVKRVLKKIDENAPHEVMLVLDASIGQNAIAQAVEFNEAVGLTGITMTKLDGTAKGGILFAVAQKLQVPLRYIGVGEHIDDLRVFNATEFVEALFTSEQVEIKEQKTEETV